SEGAQIDSSTFGSGHGGALTVAATEAISISGRSSGLFSNAFSLGDAGQIVISAPTPTLTMDDGLIQALAAAGSRGNAGGIDVRVGQLTLTGGAQLDSSTSGPGQGGRLNVTAMESIVIAGQDKAGNPSALSSNALGQGKNAGDAGDLMVSAPALIMQNGRI